MNLLRATLSSLALTVGLIACQATDDSVHVPDTSLSACCENTLTRVQEMPECCQRGTATVGAFTGCCTEGMLATTADADRPECCKTSLAIFAELSACCRETLMTGEPDDCCAAMPGALMSRMSR